MFIRKSESLGYSLDLTFYIFGKVGTLMMDHWSVLEACNQNSDLVFVNVTNEQTLLTALPKNIASLPS